MNDEKKDIKIETKSNSKVTPLDEEQLEKVNGAQYSEYIAAKPSEPPRPQGPFFSGAY